MVAEAEPDFAAIVQAWNNGNKELLAKWLRSHANNFAALAIRQGWANDWLTAAQLAGNAIVAVMLQERLKSVNSHALTRFVATIMRNDMVTQKRRERNFQKYAVRTTSQRSGRERDDFTTVEAMHLRYYEEHEAEVNEAVRNKVGPLQWDAFRQIVLEGKQQRGLAADLDVDETVLSRRVSKVKKEYLRVLASLAENQPAAQR